jgi:hypothetical protein
MKLLIIKHFNIPFHNNQNAILLFTGIHHHVILLK